MLSHHELAKLLLINRAPEQIALGDPDVDALIEKSLVDLPSRLCDENVLRITGRGIAVLRALDRADSRRSSRAALL